MWARNGRWILPEMTYFHVAFRDLLHAVNLRHGTDGFTSPPKKGVLRIFPTASAGFEPANLGTKGQHATSRPSKPHAGTLSSCIFWMFLCLQLSVKRCEHQWFWAVLYQTFTKCSHSSVVLNVRLFWYVKFDLLLSRTTIWTLPHCG
jgi:hypothetical protein